MFRGGVFDILYLGIFAILSPALDPRFYHGLKQPPATLLAEIDCAVAHFHVLLLKFSWNYIVVLEGEPVVYTYVVNRMLAEFAAATVVFSKATAEANPEGAKHGMASSIVVGHVEDILQSSYPTVLHYYSCCMERGHSYFIWTGPNLQILPQLKAGAAIVCATSKGKMLDCPANSIYLVELDPTPPTPTVACWVVKCPVPLDSEGLAEEWPAKHEVNI